MLKNSMRFTIMNDDCSSISYNFSRDWERLSAADFSTMVGRTVVKTIIGSNAIFQFLEREHPDKKYGRLSYLLVRYGTDPAGAPAVYAVELSEGESEALASHLEMLITSSESEVEE